MHQRSKCAIENSTTMVLGVVLVLVTVLAAAEVVDNVSSAGK